MLLRQKMEVEVKKGEGGEVNKRGCGSCKKKAIKLIALAVFVVVLLVVALVLAVKLTKKSDKDVVLNDVGSKSEALVGNSGNRGRVIVQILS